jgi:kinesin family protein C2/C3
MPTGLPSSIASLNSNSNSNSNSKEVISPNPSMTSTSAPNRTRSNSNISMPNDRLGSAIPLVRSRTAPQGQKLEELPQIERSHSDSVNDNNSNNSNNNNKNDHDWNLQQSTPGSPSRQLQLQPQPQLQPDPADPDSQEQAFFEQRLCDDIYGVAVRKINQNGKSNLRYVKCLYMDAPEVLLLDETNFSSNRSVSSRHSRGSRVSLPRFLGGGSSHRNSNSNTSVDNDAHRSLLRENQSNITEDSNNSASNQNNGKVRVLSWGKKKDVVVPLDMFTAVKKGKINDRSRKNHSNSSRILSLVTSDIHSTNEKEKHNSNNNSVSLDIEAPTCLDRDKFAKAFARFLNVPLIEEGDIIRAPQPSLSQSQAYVSTAFPHQQHNHRPLSPQPPGTGTDGNRSIARSIKSDMTPQSWREPYRLSITSSVANDNNDNSIPDIALTTSNSQTTGTNPRSSSWKQINIPLPVVTTSTRGISAGKNSATKPPRNNRRSTSNPLGGVLVAAPPIHPGIPVNPKPHNNTNTNTNTYTNNIIINGSSSRTGSETDDPPLASLPSSTRSRGGSNTNNNTNNRNTTTSSSTINKKGKMILEIPFTTKSKLSKNSNSNHDRSTPATSAISARTTPDTPATNTNTNTTSASNNNNNDVNVNNNFNVNVNVNVDSINANNLSRDTTTDDSDSMDGSVVSSITGVGFDQDLVEELHMALEKMKVELEDSRAEASRAVKVAEQAIQSAEHSSSKDWNNTVTHKAAEAAATAQKRSAEAMAKARIAEERLELERKNALLRTKQVEEAEQQAAHWQTRAAAAEVQRFAVAEALESERKKNQAHVVLPLQALESERKKNEDLMLQAKMAISGSLKRTGSKTEPPSSPSKPKTFTESAEIDRLHSKLAMERARRRKLLDELQDLRGAIRVYCRLRAPSSVVTASTKQAAIEMISNEVLMLHRNNNNTSSSSSSSSPSTPLCFEFDGILASDMGQQDVYAEFEAICASVVEGFKICVMSYGQANSGKTHTMLGDVHVCSNNNNNNSSSNKVDDGRSAVSIENKGIHLRATKQLFSLLEHRKDRFQDTITMNLVEVHDEKLIDLLAGTDFGEQHGKVESRKSSRRSTTEDTKSPPRKPSELKPKLEIKTNRDGETVVRGVLSVDLASFDDVLRVWTESLAKRSDRLSEQKVEDPSAYERDSHLVATLKVTSKNRSTGSTAYGKMQFVDFAASDITTKRPLGSSGGVSSFLSKSSSKRLPQSSGSFSEQLQQPDEWKFTNKSLNTVREVVLARSQYQRSVPYRNSTITHILSDSLEADTKVVLIACVSCDDDDLSNTACTLKLAQEMRKVIVGKATRHTAIDYTGSSSSYVNSNISSNSISISISNSNCNSNCNSNSNMHQHKIHDTTAAI